MASYLAKRRRVIRTVRDIEKDILKKYEETLHNGSANVYPCVRYTTSCNYILNSFNCWECLIFIFKAKSCVRGVRRGARNQQYYLIPASNAKTKKVPYVIVCGNVHRFLLFGRKFLDLAIQIRGEEVPLSP